MDAIGARLSGFVAVLRLAASLLGRLAASLLGRFS
jgi:hypothetical protein